MRTLTDLRKLRHVVGVARAGSFTSAATALAITQSALTKSVAEVEHLLGIKLFERLPRGVALTEAGQRFVPRAERILGDTSDLMNELGDVQSLATGRLRIGVTPAAYVSFLEHTASAFAKIYPGVGVEVVEGPVDSVAQMVVTGELDLVVGGVNYLSVWTALETQSVAPLNISFVGRIDHPLADSDAPTARELLSYPVIMPTAGLTTEAQLMQAYVDAGLTPVPAHYVCDHFPLVKALVANTDAVSPVVSLSDPTSLFAAQFHVFEDVVPLEQPILGLGFSRRREPSPAARAFMKLFAGFLADSSS